MVQVIDCRVQLVLGAEHLPRLRGLIWRPDVGDVHRGYQHAFLVAQRDRAAGLDAGRELLADVERDRHRPQRAVGQAHVVDDAVVLGLRQKALERRERAVQQQLDVAHLPVRQVPRDIVPSPGLLLLRRLLVEIQVF